MNSKAFGRSLAALRKKNGYTQARLAERLNIFTDLCKAGERAMKAGLAEGKGYLEIRNMKVAEIKEAVKEKIRLFGCD